MSCVLGKSKPSRVAAQQAELNIYGKLRIADPIRPFDGNCVSQKLKGHNCTQDTLKTNI